MINGSRHPLWLLQQQSRICLRVFLCRFFIKLGASDSSGAFSGSSEATDNTIANALAKAGFQVNPTLKAVYAGSNTYMGSESGTSSQYDSDGAYHGVDYEEGIYLGYKYYETRYFDMYNAAADDAGREAAHQWWAENVTYPFGYGLSC